VTAGIVRIRFAVPAETLKEKRTVVKSVVERLRNRFNAAVVEADDLDTPGLATIAAAVLSNDPAHVDSQMQAIATAVEEWRLDVEVLSVETEQIAL